jgi:hypothetical protein
LLYPEKDESSLFQKVNGRTSHGKDFGFKSILEIKNKANNNLTSRDRSYFCLCDDSGLQRTISEDEHQRIVQERDDCHQKKITDLNKKI